MICKIVDLDFLWKEVNQSAMEDIAIQLVHGRTKHTVQINPMLPLRSLMDKVEELTGIPQSGQKLICQGQTLTSQACVLLIYSYCVSQIQYYCF